MAILSVGMWFIFCKWLVVAVWYGGWLPDADNLAKRSSSCVSLEKGAFCARFAARIARFVELGGYFGGLSVVGGEFRVDECAVVG